MEKDQNPFKSIAMLGGVLLIGFVILSSIRSQEIPSLELASQLAQVNPTATLTLSPASRSVTVGSTFTVSILLNTGGQNIYGVDINRLRFNPSVLQVVDANTSVSGVQIAPGTLMDTIANSVDNTAGTVSFSQILIPSDTSGPRTYSGSGTLATITFRAQAAGTANVTFDFTSGSGTDTNVAGLGGDILSSVSGGIYTVTAVVTDTQAPVISSVSSSNITTTGATISWTTNENADTQVDYGSSASYGSQTTLNTTMSTSHTATLSGLSPGTTYHYRVRSRDAAGNLGLSADSIFNTQAATDTTAPSVPASLTATPTGETQVQVSWNASTDTAGSGQSSSGVADYQVFRGSTLVRTTATTAFLDTGLTAGTTYSYQVLARDVAGNVSAKSASVSATTPTQSLEVKRKLIIVMEGAPTAKRNIAGTVEFLDPATKTKIFQASINTNTAGEYTVDIPPGLLATVTLRPVIVGYISKILPGVDLRDANTLEVNLPSLPAGDFNGDQRINSLDYSYMNGKWGTADALADVDRNGDVNTIDFSFMSKNWMLEGE